MSDLIVKHTILERLNAIADREQRPLDDILADMIDQYRPYRTTASWAAQMAQMAAEDDNPAWDRLPTDLAQRSRQILEDEFAASLNKRSEKTHRDE